MFNNLRIELAEKTLNDKTSRKNNFALPLVAEILS